MNGIFCVAGFNENIECSGRDFSALLPSGRFFLKDDIFVLADNEKAIHNSETGIFVGYAGYITNILEVTNKYSLVSRIPEEVVAELYSKFGERAFVELDGVFTIFVWDAIGGKGYIFQDKYGSNLPVYYIQCSECFVFSTSLKALLLCCKLERRFNIEAARQFLYTKREVPNEQTLVEGISKLIPGQMMMLSKDGYEMQLRSVKRSCSIVSREEAKKLLIDSIEREVVRLERISDTEELGVALSSGYDTNLILKSLSGCAGKRITAVTIGGKTVNEIPEAKKCAGVYKNVKHITSVIGPERLQSLPDIVWRLEGYLFERGIVLAYEFASIMSGLSQNNIFLGDGADQVLQQYSSFAREKGKRMFVERVKGTALGRFFYRVVKKERNDIKHKQARVVKSFRVRSQDIKYDIIIDYILKKNGILLNSFGIDAFYPFLGERTRAYSGAIKDLLKRKKFYKDEVEKRLPSSIRDIVLKVGGSTDIEYLLENENEMIVSLMSKKLIKKIFTAGEIKDIVAFPGAYPEIIFQLLYLYVFDKLFISREYDHLLNESGSGIMLKDLF